MDKKIVGKIIKQFRINKKWSQDILCDFACVNRSHLSRVELGKGSPTLTFLYKIADALEVNASDILRAVENEAKLNEK